MIASPEKLEDMKARDECLEFMEFSLRVFNRTGDEQYRKYAEEFGAMSRNYAERIRKNDYAALDKKWAHYHKFFS